MENFFEFVSRNFSREASMLLKSWLNINTKLIKIGSQLSFLNTCKRNNLLPPHLGNLPNIAFHHSRAAHRQENIRRSFLFKTLRNEILDGNNHLRFLKREIIYVTRRINNILPYNICNDFYDRQHLRLTRLRKMEDSRLNRKFIKLYQKTLDSRLEKIKPITYFALVRDGRNESSQRRLRSRTITTNNNDINISFSFESKTHLATDEVHDIVLKAQAFRCEIERSPLSLNNKWFANLTDRDIPVSVQGLLQLGANFSLPIKNKRDKDKTVMEIIKCIESNIIRDTNINKINVRNHTVSMIQKFLNMAPSYGAVEQEILSSAKTTKEFLRDNTDILVTRADKGNITVAMSKSDYVNKMSTLLDDSETYTIVNRDPTQKVISQLQSLLRRWRNKEYITNPVYRRLYRSDGHIPRAYGLPKIHKPECPLRIIVSSINSPLYELALYIHRIINDSLPAYEFSAGDSFHLVNKLRLECIPSGFELISLDVVSLFTNIPSDLAVESILRRWNMIAANTKIPQDEFVSALRFILNSTYFTFNNNIYKQTFGSPMGSPLSPIIADLVLRDLEAKALGKLHYAPPFYYRYVDDILLAAPPSFFHETLNTFNSFHNRLQFTMEVGTNNSLNFLDITMINNEGRLIFDWYHKPTFSGRYLNYLSQHPMSQKRGVAFGLIDRAFLLSHPSFHQKNLNLVVSILLQNNYPVDVVFDWIRTRIKTLFNRIHEARCKIKTPTDVVNYMTIPYIRNLSERFSGVAESTGRRLTFSAHNKLSNIIKVHKDVLPTTASSNVVYMIRCSDCDNTYVGQTSRQLRTRVKEHKRVNYRDPTVVHTHALDHDHRFDWDNVAVLDRESFYFRRLISEMLFIKRQNNGLNLQSDTEYLGDAYAPVLARLDGITNINL